MNTFEKQQSSNKESSDETITISKSYYDRLIEDQKLLIALQDVGVDNWEGYGDDAIVVVDKSLLFCMSI